MPLDRPLTGADAPPASVPAVEPDSRTSVVEAKLRRLDEAALRTEDAADSREHDVSPPQSTEQSRVESKLEALDQAAMRSRAPADSADRPTAPVPPPTVSEVKAQGLDRSAFPGPATPDAADRTSSAAQTPEITSAERKAALLDPPLGPVPPTVKVVAPAETSSVPSGGLADSETAKAANPPEDFDAPAKKPDRAPEPESDVEPDVEPNLPADDIASGPVSRESPTAPVPRSSPGADSVNEQSRPSDSRPGSGPEAIQPPEPAAIPELATKAADTVQVAEQYATPDSPNQPREEGGRETGQVESGRLPMTQEDFWSRHPEEYIPPDASTPRPDVKRPLQSPQEWVADVNPDTGERARRFNCGECGRATELNWRGVPSIAGVLSDPRLRGEQLHLMQEWAGSEAQETDSSQIAKDLTERGSGSSALIAINWRSGGGHWFNAVNDDGRILAVDGQSGRVGAWPPSERTLGYSDNQIARYRMITLDGAGRPVRKEQDDK